MVKNSSSRRVEPEKMQLIECVPNFSEGRDARVIKQIARAIESVQTVRLMHVDSSYDANRTVMTFAGPPEAVCEAAFKAIECAQKTIDMTQHEGIHPRIGATDVCPLVPIRNIEMQECIGLSEDLARRVGESLGIPVFMYAKSAHKPQYQKLSFLRRDNYEALEERLTKKDLIADYGPQRFNALSGATAIGARAILIAYNINLDTSDVAVASAIAKSVRNIRDGLREPVFMELLNCQAIGWYVNEYQCAQVSTNILDYKTTRLVDLFESVRRLAEEKNVRVTGSELIGLVPLRGLLGPGFTKKSDSEKEIAITGMVAHLGLSSLKQFDWRKRILEIQFADFGWE
jgi:glutamate formiminotransferase